MLTWKAVSLGPDLAGNHPSRLPPSPTSSWVLRVTCPLRTNPISEPDSRGPALGRRHGLPEQPILGTGPGQQLCCWGRVGRSGRRPAGLRGGGGGQWGGARGRGHGGWKQPAAGGGAGSPPQSPHSRAGSRPCCCPGTGSWPAASSSCATAWTPGSSPPARRWGRSAGGLSGGRAGAGSPAVPPLVSPCPPGPAARLSLRLTLGTKPGSTFFWSRSSHSTWASEGVACMSWRLETRCLGFTVRSWKESTSDGAAPAPFGTRPSARPGKSRPGQRPEGGTCRVSGVRQPTRTAQERRRGRVWGACEVRPSPEPEAAEDGLLRPASRWRPRPGQLPGGHLTVATALPAPGGPGRARALAKASPGVGLHQHSPLELLRAEVPPGNHLGR